MPTPFRYRAVARRGRQHAQGQQRRPAGIARPAPRRPRPHPDAGKSTPSAARVAEPWDHYRDPAYLDAAGQPVTDPAPSRSCSATSAPQRLAFNVYAELRDRLADRRARPGPGPLHPRGQHRPGQGTTLRRLPLRRVDVLIGSTEKMGVGTNIQARAVALHHLDCPWRPADIEQREGRIIRQGNQNRVVHVLRYVTEGSFDPYMWQTLERKARFIAQVMSPADPHEQPARSRTSTPKWSSPTPRSKRSPPATR